GGDEREDAAWDEGQGAGGEQQAAEEVAEHDPQSGVAEIDAEVHRLGQQHGDIGADDDEGAQQRQGEGEGEVAVLSGTDRRGGRRLPRLAGVCGHAGGPVIRVELRWWRKADEWIARMLSAFTWPPHRPDQSATVSPRVTVPVSATSMGALSVFPEGRAPDDPFATPEAAPAPPCRPEPSGPLRSCRCHPRAHASTNGSWMWAR